MINKLIRLQKLDHELDELRDRAQVYKDKLSVGREDFENRQKQMEEEHFRNEALEKERLNLNDTLTLEETRLRKSKARIGEIKTNYEYQAMRREIETTERSNSELEDQILIKIEEIELSRKQIEEIRTGLEESKGELERVEKEVGAKEGEFGGILGAKEEDRKKMVGEVDRPLLSQYQLIRQRKFRDALVSVVGGSCQGCFMNVPPQMVIEMLRSDKVFTCPNCQRMLYAPQPDEKTA